MQSRSIKLIVLLLTMMMEPLMAASLTGGEDTRSEIAALVAAEAAAWNKGNAEEFADRALPDISFTNIFGMFSVGKAPFVAQHERIFSTIYKDSTNQLQIEHIALVKPDIAIVDILTMVSGVERPPPGIQFIDGALHSRLQQVLVRRSDGWWIASFHNVAVNPAYPPKP
jgi:uncharacterized protein (TIGR02246 family)